MLNMIKMDFSRLLRTRSILVIWLIMVIIIFFTTSLVQTEYAELPTELQQMEEPSDIGFGMTVSFSNTSGEALTLFDMLYANLQAKFTALFIIILAVLFSSADLACGYIKNIGGQVANRGLLYCSKAVVLFPYTLATLLLFVLAQALANQLFLANGLLLGDIAPLLTYLGVQLLLHYALALICMTITAIIRSRTFQMLLSVCLCMNIMSIVCSVLDKLLQRFGLNGADTYSYTVTGNITLLPVMPTKAEALFAIGISVVFIILMPLVGGFIFQKRDIPPCES